MINQGGSGYSLRTVIIFSPAQAVYGGIDAVVVPILNLDTSISLSVLNGGKGYLNPKIMIKGSCGVTPIPSAESGSYQFLNPIYYIEVAASPDLYSIVEEETLQVVGFHNYITGVVEFDTFYPFIDYPTNLVPGVLPFPKGELLAFSEVKERSKLVTDDFLQLRKLFDVVVNKITI